MPHPLLLSVALFLGLWFLSTSRSSIRCHSILHIRATSNWLQTCGEEGVEWSRECAYWCFCWCHYWSYYNAPWCHEDKTDGSGTRNSVRRNCKLCSDYPKRGRPQGFLEGHWAASAVDRHRWVHLLWCAGENQVYASWEEEPRSQGRMSEARFGWLIYIAPEFLFADESSSV